jgi:hypothetical protein
VAVFLLPKILPAPVLAGWGGAGQGWNGLLPFARLQLAWAGSRRDR